MVRQDGTEYQIPTSITLSREIFELAMFGEAWGDPMSLVLAARDWMAQRTAYRAEQAEWRMQFSRVPEGSRPIRTVPREDWMPLGWPLGD